MLFGLKWFLSERNDDILNEYTAPSVQIGVMGTDESGHHDRTKCPDQTFRQDMNEYQRNIDLCLYLRILNSCKGVIDL